MNTFLLEGPGGIPGLRLSKGFTVQTNSTWQFNNPVAFLGGVTGQTPTIIDGTAGVTLTAAQSGATILLDHASGGTFTLPTDAPGLNFRFIVITTVTSVGYKVITASVSSFIQGYLNVPVAAGTAKYFFGDGTTDVSINLNGTTTGGLLSGEFTLTCLKSGLWQASGNVEGSGTVATPFGTS